jgi:hypothetical protein
MATPRKRSSGFTNATEDEVTREELVEEVTETLQEVIDEEVLLEVTPVETKTKQPTQVFIEESIIPTEDLGVRFVEDVKKPSTPAITPREEEPKPKRHPRNTPRFSRTR